MIDWARDFTADAYAAFADVGMDAHAATYTAPTGGVALPCTVLIDRAAQTIGEFGTYVGGHTVVSLQLAEVPAPAQGGIVVTAAETWKLDKVISQDGVESRWVVKK